ncbi:MAG: hypothetical protein FWD05_02345 [Oscillospiraceae bacterium]|nr:hypothetical protein [Oscillospiraceae bacterium]
MKATKMMYNDRYTHIIYEMGLIKVKKYLTIFIAILLLATLISCGNDSNEIRLPNAMNGVSESERTTITLGVVENFPTYQVDYAMWYVSTFNEENEHYSIEIVHYIGDDVMRLRTELIAGRGPDIIYSFLYDENIFGPLINQDMLVDLWSLIDADPVINRDDFFQNILEANQRPDGSLRTIANQFTITTLISTPESIGHTQSLTISCFIEIIRNAHDIGTAYPTDILMSGSDFIISMLMFTDIGIIDFDGGVSHFESRVFYDLLELASLLTIRETAVIDPDVDRLTRLRNGEYIFLFDLISDANSFVRYETLLGNFTIMGFPSDEGGRHDAMLTSNLGINVNSKNQDAAWSFVRQYLLPSSLLNFGSGMPMRIDLFERQVAEAMREIPERYRHENGISIYPDALSEEGANTFREIVESISFVSRFDHTIASILMEELSPFFTGSRTAEETARITQSRVQRYLHERS